METQKASIKNIALTYGVLLALFSIIVSVITYITGNHLQPKWYVSVISLLVSVYVIVLAIKKYKTGNEGFLSLGEAIKVGLAVSVISGILIAIYNYIFMTVIEPDMVNQIMEISREEMIESNPNMPEEQMEMALNMSQKFMQPWIMSTFAILGSLFTGFIISLISGLIMKQNRPDFQ